jgi:hypothetical protein
LERADFYALELGSLDGTEPEAGDRLRWRRRGLGSMPKPSGTKHFKE